jgi:hypothetical protein
MYVVQSQQGCEAFRDLECARGFARQTHGTIWPKSSVTEIQGTTVSVLPNTLPLETH